MDKPSHWVTFFNDIFNPMFVFVNIWPKIVLKQPSIFESECNHYWRCRLITNQFDVCSMHQPCDFVHDLWFFFFWFLSVRPSPPKCSLEGSEEKGGSVSLRCKSSQGSSPLKYTWTKESGNMPRTATQSEWVSESSAVNAGLAQH